MAVATRQSRRRRTGAPNLQPHDSRLPSETGQSATLRLSVRFLRCRWRPGRGIAQPIEDCVALPDAKVASVDADLEECVQIGKGCQISAFPLEPPPSLSPVVGEDGQTALAVSPAPAKDLSGLEGRLASRNMVLNQHDTLTLMQFTCNAAI